MNFKTGDKAVINGKLYTLLTDTDEQNYALFQNDLTGGINDLYCGRLAHLIQPMETAPKDGSWVWLVDEEQAVIGYFHINPDIEWATGFTGDGWGCVLDPKGWAQPHSSELPIMIHKGNC